MEANNKKAIGNWLSDIDDGSLCLPRFQREQVWKKKEICEFITTLILEPDTPVGTFLVLATDPSNPLFPPRSIDGSRVNSPTCHSLLLDGQQRLSALWKVLHDKDDDFSYYVKYNMDFHVECVIGIRKTTKIVNRMDKNPTLAFRRNQFPAYLLNPMEDTAIVNDWLDKIDPNQISTKQIKQLKRLAEKLRNVFSRKKGTSCGKVIPFFRLPSDVDRSTAVDIFKTINTNLVKLTKHYLAVAEMEKITGKSLYDMAQRLEKHVPPINDLETDEIGELILKISCLLQNKNLSGSNYLKLDFNQILLDENTIKSGVKWAVEQLNNLNIWHGKQLPTIVPIRVLSALHCHIPKSGTKLAKANRIISKYLWHAFLTERYEIQANERLREDYIDLVHFLNGDINPSEITIFDKNTYPIPSLDKIKEANWPKSTNCFPRGVLLVCCQDGAKTLASDENLNATNYLQRERHHIFPKSKMLSAMGENYEDLAANCMLVPSIDNNLYGNELPGEYIEKLFDGLGETLSQVKVVNRLKTHLIEEKVAENLVETTEKNVSYDPIQLTEAYNKFIERRARTIYHKIQNLLD